MQLFKRAWTITVGARGTTGFQTSELDCKFKVKRSLSGRAGKCELEVYNLTAQHRAEAKAARTPYVSIAAGYAEGTATIFQGNTRKVDDVRENTTWTLKITGGDGEAAIRTQRVTRSFAPGTNVRQVVQAIADAMGVGVGNAVTALAGVNVSFPSGTVLRGRCGEELGRLCDSVGYTWSVQGDNLLLLPNGGALAREAVLLSPDTGLIGSPEQGKHGVVKAKTLLIPHLVPGQLVQLQSRGTNGVFRIETAEYTGESRGTGAGSWGTELILRARAP